MADPKSDRSTPVPPVRDQELNFPAVVSLICGVLGCIPGVGLAAIVAGWLGVRRGNDPRYGAKNLAVFGIIAGIVTTVLSGSMYFGAAMTYKAYLRSKPSADVARVIVQQLSAQNTAATRTMSEPALAQGKLNEAAASLKAVGPITEAKLDGYSVDYTPTPNVIDISGNLTAERGTRLVLLRFHDDTGRPLLFDLRITDPARPTTQKPQD